MTEFEEAMELAERLIKLSVRTPASVSTLSLRTSGLVQLCNATLALNKEILDKLDLVLERTDPERDPSAEC